MRYWVPVLLVLAGLSPAAASAAILCGGAAATADAQWIGGYAVTLSTCGTAAVLQIRDAAGRPVDVSGFSAASWTRTPYGDLRRVEFRPAEGNALVGRIDFTTRRLAVPAIDWFRPVVTLHGPEAALGSACFSVQRSY